MTPLEISPPARRLLKPAITAPLRAARAFDDALAFVLEKQRIEHQSRAYIVTCDDDERLITLTYKLNHVGNDVAEIQQCAKMNFEKAGALCWNNLRFHLANLGAFALIWATPNHLNFNRGCQAIARERRRQRGLLAVGRFFDDCAGPATDNRKKFRVLFEECGEVAYAIDRVEHHFSPLGNLHKKLTRVAAVCVAWLETEGTQR